MNHATVRTGDGAEIAATTFGDAKGCRAGVLIVSAMAVEQDYYEPFAQWLAERGHFVATFDYRGIGRSRKGPLRRVAADVVTWAREDTGAMVDFVARQIGERPLLWVGHSLGGQILGLVPTAHAHRGGADSRGGQRLLARLRARAAPARTAALVRHRTDDADDVRLLPRADGWG